MPDLDFWQLLTAMANKYQAQFKRGAQYAVRAPGGEPQVYGDQSWVASGRCITDGSYPPGSTIWRRPVIVSYGPWKQVEPGLIGRSGPELVWTADA